MQIDRPVALASLFFLLLGGACASTPQTAGSSAASREPLRGGVAEFQVASYDGVYLKGRVLIGATADTLVIDGRLHPSWDVRVTNMRACGKNERIRFWSIEPLFFAPPRAEEIITLRPGYWYGGNVSFLLADDEARGVGLPCFEAELLVLARGSRVAARLPIRVVRTDKLPTTQEGHPEEPRTPPSDVGAH